MEPAHHASLDHFAELVRHHQSAVCAAAYGVTGDRALSEDIAQDTFVVAWRGLPTLRDPAKVRGWLRGIARNLALKARRKAAPTDDLDDHLAAASDDAKDQERVTWAAVRALPAKYREALVLYYWEDCSAKQVADALGISEATATKRLSRGRALLRDEIERRVEGTLRRGRPGAALTAAILAAVAAGTAGSASAATATSHVVARSLRGVWVLVSGLGVIVATVGVAAALSSPRSQTSEHHVASATNHAVVPGAASSSMRPGTQASTPPRAARVDRESSVDELDPDGRFTTVEITTDEHDPWLTPALRHALSPCFTDALVEHPARVAVTVRAGKIAGVALEPLPDGELVAACTQTKLMGASIAGPDTTHHLQISGQRFTPKKVDREAFVDLDVKTGPSRGPRDARVSIVTFLDVADGGGYGAKIIDALSQVLAKYPSDVRVVVKLCPFPGHELAAEAVYAANAQGALWPMLERIGNARDRISLDDLIGHASALHLDVARFRSELTSHAYRDELELDHDQMTTMDIHALPSSIINGKRVHGALQIADYVASVEDALAH